MSVKLSCIGQAIRGYVDFSRMLILQKIREYAIYQKEQKWSVNRICEDSY
jgi:hypothetical protein